MSDDLKTLVAQEVAKQLAAIAADQTTKKVLDYLKANGGGNYKVIEEWKSEDGSSWYRKWSSGFKEVALSVPGTESNHTFPIAFSDTNYIVVCGSVADNTVTADNTIAVLWGWAWFGLSKKTTSGISRGGNASDGSKEINIYAFGY